MSTVFLHIREKEQAIFICYVSNDDDDDRQNKSKLLTNFSSAVITVIKHRENKNFQIFKYSIIIKW
jgi:sporulation-control protein spo0M